MTPEAAKSLAEAGPWAVLIFFVGVVGVIVVRILIVLWRDHLLATERDRAQRDQAEANDRATKDLLRLSLQNNADVIAVWNKRIELDAARQRKADRP